VIERAYVFGSHEGLVGVLCEPEGGLVAERPVAVCANVGLNHRVGPNRLWVELARRLAQAGYATLRFDLSGFGDSLPRRDTRGDLERAVLDLQEALDFLAARRGARRFVLVANCSGTDSQHTLSLRDERVCGLLTIDGYAYRDASYWLRRALRVFQPARWRRRALQRRLRREGAQREPGAPRAEVWTRDIPTRAAFAADLDRLAARGVRALFLFTSGADLRYNHRGQFHRMFGHRDTVEVAWDGHADHLLSTAADRERFLRQALDWLRRCFPPDGGRP
jgi:pimeloyl-ACP methyl ester carboxylesterase